MSKQEQQSEMLKSAGLLRKFWRFFSSIRLALALILLLSGLSLLGTLIPVVNAFHSWWFLTAGGLLMLNIIICTLNRWGNIKLSLHGGTVIKEESFYSAGLDRTEIEIPGAGDSAVQTPVSILQKHGYRVRSESKNGNLYAAADKNRFFRLGTYASHLSLVLFVLAYLLGSYFGFKDTNFVVAVGNTEQIQHNTGLSLQLVSFTDEYYPDNTPKDYRSQVILSANDLPVDQGLVRVNHPLNYKGISIHQMFFGPAVQVQIMQNGQTVYLGVVALSNLVNNQGLQRYVGSVDLPDGFNIQFISPAVNVQDPVIPPGQLAVFVKQNGTQTGVDTIQLGIIKDISGLSFNYQNDTKFSGFQISRDPGNTLVWIAAVLFIIGVIMVLYFPHRQVWILSKSQSSKPNRLLIRLGVPRGYNAASELKTLTDDIEKLSSEVEK